MSNVPRELAVRLPANVARRPSPRPAPLSSPPAAPAAPARGLSMGEVVGLFLLFLACTFLAASLLVSLTPGLA